MGSSAYLPVFFRAPVPADDEFELDGDEGRHAARVRRVRVTERLRIADGDGKYADCSVTSVGQSSVRLRVDARGFDEPRSPRIVVVQAIPKADRGSLAVELLTEIGVDEIIPWQAAHCVSRWDGKADKGRVRWAAIAREAAKQSRRTRIPKIGELIGPGDIATVLSDAQLVVLHESASVAITEAPLDTDRDVVLVVGPEGGVSLAELDIFRACDARIVRLGPEVLRTSTAGLAAASWASLKLNRWS